MAARTQYQRKAAARVSYAPPEESEASDDEWGGGASSTAHKARKVALHAEESDSGDASAESSSGDEFRLGQARKKAKRPRKKTKHTKKAEGKAERAPKAKKRVGKLEAVKLVPTEVLLEIFSYLSPGDLLALSKVSKSYRSIVTGDKSKSLWARARAKYKLPRITSGGFTELQYAGLMFGKGCTSCARGKGIPDFHLRKKLCRSCRKSSLVRLDQLGNAIPDVHPRTRDCVMSTTDTPWRMWPSKRWALLDDIKYWSNRLWDLEYEAESEAPSGEEEGKDSTSEEDEEGLVATGEERARSGRQLRHPARKRISYVDISSDDEETKPVYGKRRRVVNLVKARQDYFATLEPDFELMRKADCVLEKQLREESRGDFAPGWYDGATDRMHELKNRVRNEMAEVSDSDFNDYAYMRHRLVRSKKPLTDDGWDLIRNEILKLVRRVRRRRVQEAALREMQQRQSSLRPRYDKLLAAQPPKWKLFVPLFTDFLLFESVRPLWDRPSDPREADWLAAQSLIVEELEGWRLEIVAHASAVTAAAASASETDSRPSELDFEEGGKVDLLEASWLVSRFVSCAYQGCQRAVRRLGPSWRRAKGGDDWVGSLHDVLQHQQLAHNSANCLEKKGSKVGSHAEVRLAAHPEVVSAVSALLDVAELDPASATTADLDDFERQVTRWEWENGRGRKRYHGFWRTLLGTIKVAGDTARRKGENLDTPCIVAYLRDTPSSQKQANVGHDESLSEDDALGNWIGELDEQSRSEDSEPHYKGHGEHTTNEEEEEEEENEEDDEDDDSL